VHEGVETLISLCMPCVGEVEGEHGGCELGRSQVALHEAGMHASFEPMGGIRMPQGMDGHAQLDEAGTLLGSTEGALHTGATHGRGGRRTVGVSAPGGGKEPGGVTMGVPGRAEQCEGILRQGDVPVFGTLAAVDRDLEALAIDVGDLQEAGCMEPEAQAVASGEGAVVVHGGAEARSRLPSSTLRTAGSRWGGGARRSDRVCQSRLRTC
jgi:hypothetical protein